MQDMRVDTSLPDNYQRALSFKGEMVGREASGLSDWKMRTMTGSVGVNQQSTS